MSEHSRKLYDILVVCVLRYGQAQDSRFALAALVAYQALQGVLKPEVIGYVEGKMKEIQERVVATIPQQRKTEASCATLAAFVRSVGLIEALKGKRAAGFDRDIAKASLRRIAPDLDKAIETYDLPAVYNFLKPEYALRAVA